MTIVLLSFTAEYQGYFAFWTRRFGGARMAPSHRSAESQTVFLAVDASSLAEVGGRPWPRDLHAKLREVVTDAGALETALENGEFHMLYQP